MRTSITHPKATATTTTRAAAALAVLLLVLTACDSSSATDPSASATDAKNGDKKADTVVRTTYRGGREDLVALYAAGNTDDPVLTFSTALFLP
ncbi:hypothetical protein ABZX72_04210 [Streptomyces cyaneofuscatus]